MDYGFSLHQNNFANNKLAMKLKQLEIYNPAHCICFEAHEGRIQDLRKGGAQ